MALPFLVQLVIGVGLQILGFLLAPKPAGPKPASTEDLKSPTAEAGRPIPVVFGSITTTGPNLIFMGDKESLVREVDAK